MSERQALRVLVADEQREYFEAIRECAELCRHQFTIECEFVDTERTLLSALSRFRPSVVLLDAHIPHVDSFDMIRQCHLGEVSVILTSKHMSSEISDSAKQHGASGYVSKSFDMEEVEALLNQLMNLCPEISLAEH